MIKYRYNLKKDIKNAIWTINDRGWFKDHSDIVVFWPNPLRWLWLMLWMMLSKKPNLEYEKDITCYWVSSGTWGSYHPDNNEIRICPWKIKTSPDGSVEEVIKHEITHLLHPEADEFEHDEKEKYIEKETLKEFTS